MGGMIKVILVGVALAWSAVLAKPPGALSVESDPATGLIGWHWQGEHLTVELAQLLPDQTRAFFLGRGFEPALADRIAESCVFQSIMRNVGSDGELALDLQDWRTHAVDGSKGLRLNRDWQTEWEAKEAAESARIAFRWALFPTEHRFEPGDWLMGMIVFDRPPGETFDLELTWQEAGESRRVMLRDVRCAPDVDPSELTAEHP